MSLPSFISMYQQLIAAPSISAIEDSLCMSNKNVIEVLAQWCESLGFKGDGGLMLAGHTDTVPFDDSRWNHNPFKLTEHNNKLYGLGSIDMKGFFAFVLQAISELDEKQQTQPILILATADEETTMAGAQQICKHPNLKPDRCIIGEPTDMTPVFTHKGHMSTAIRVVGRSGHSSDPERGVNAIEVMHKVITKLLILKEQLKHKYSIEHFEIPYPTLNFGNIHGGDNANRICGCCEMHIDMRPLPGLSVQELQMLVLDATHEINQQYPNAVSVIDLHEPIPAFTGSTDSALVKLAEKIAGQKAVAVNYCTEAPFIQQLGCETIVMGPGSINQAHQPDEFLAMEKIKPSQQIITNIIKASCFSFS